LIVLLVACCCGSAWAQWRWTPQTRRWINVSNLPKETPELQLEYARSLMLEGRYSEALKQTEKFAKFYNDTEFADDNQFLRAEIQLRQGNLSKAAEEFQQVVVNYPDSDLYSQVIEKQYAVGDGFYDKGLRKQDQKWTLFKNRPFKRAIDVYTMVINNQPFTRAAAEAQYKVGLCHYTRAEYMEAAYEYRRVIEDYSTSEWVDDAQYGLAMCYYKGSRPPEYDQLPSQLCINAVNEFNEKFPLDNRVGELTGIRDEMRQKIAGQRLETARYYEKRRNFRAARIYYRIVADEFGDTSVADTAREWLDSHPADPTTADAVLGLN